MQQQGIDGHHELDVHILGIERIVEDAQVFDIPQKDSDCNARDVRGWIRARAA